MVFSGPAQVVSSGEATTFFGQPLLVTVPMDEGPFVLEWQFDDGEVAEVTTEPIPNGLRFVCRGLDGTAGKGTSEPVIVGERGSDYVMVHFRSTRWGASVDRTVHWSVYRVNRDRITTGSPDGE